MSSAGQRGASTNTVRAVALVAVAIVVGVLVLHSIGGNPSSSGSAQSAKATATSTPVTPTSTTVRPPSTTTSTTAPSRPPSQVTTLVANGTTTTGAAARVEGLLQKSGYDVLSPTNTRAPASSSSVYYAASYSREATAVAELLGLAPSSVLGMPSTPVVANLRGADVLVVVGPDLANPSGSH